MRKGERWADVCLSVNRTWTAETHGKEVELPQACPWSLGLLGKAASVQSDTCLSVSLTIFLSARITVFIFIVTTLQPPSHNTRSPRWVGKPYKQTQEVLDLQCLFSRPPEMLEEHIPRCMSFYANILCTSLATDKNPINWEWTKEVCFDFQCHRLTRQTNSLSLNWFRHV